MQIWTPAARADGGGEFPVRFVSPGAVSFAVIELSADGATALVMQNPADCDRLMAAAAKSKDLLLGQPAVERQRIVDLNAPPESKNAGSDAR